MNKFKSTGYMRPMGYYQTTMPEQQTPQQTEKTEQKPSFWQKLWGGIKSFGGAILSPIIGGLAQKGGEVLQQKIGEWAPKLQQKGLDVLNQGVSKVDNFFKK